MELNVDEGVLMALAVLVLGVHIEDGEDHWQIEHGDGDEKSPGCHPEPWILHGGLFVLYSGEYQRLLTGIMMVGRES